MRSFFGAIVGLLYIFIMHMDVGHLIEDVYYKQSYEENNQQPTYEDGYEESIEQISNLGNNPSESPCNKEVFNYLNKRIVNLLERYPKKTPIELNLDNLFNAEREKLGSAHIFKIGPLSNCKKSELIIERFKDFANKYEVIRRKIWTALEQLKLINQSPQYSILAKNDALKIRITIKDVDSLHAAQQVLEQYESFIQSLQYDAGRTGTGFVPGSGPGSGPGPGLVISGTVPPNQLKDILTSLLQYFKDIPNKPSSPATSPIGNLGEDIKQLVDITNHLLQNNNNNGSGDGNNNNNHNSCNNNNNDDRCVFKDLWGPYIQALL